MTWLLIAWLAAASLAALAAGRCIRRREDDAAAARARPKLAFAELASGGRQPRPAEMTALDHWLGQLEGQEPRLAKVALLRWIGGLSPARAAAVLDIAPSEVERDLATARAVLRGAARGPRRA